jgi:hypothetical protein
VRGNVLGLLAAAIVLRFWDLGRLPGLNADEAWYGLAALDWLHRGQATWQTPMGNPLNVFYFGPVLALHSWFAPSIWLLRLPAVASGLAGLGANYFLARRLWGDRYAAASTVLLAALPINIAYSRLGWDASQTLLASTLVVLPALLAIRERRHAWRWLAAALAAYAAAMLVHPANIFLGPVLFSATVVAFHEPLNSLWRSTARWPVIVVLLVAAGMACWVVRDWLALGAGRFADPWEAARVVLSLERVLYGTAVYRYMAGSLRPFAPGGLGSVDFGWYDVAGFALASVLAVGVWQRLRGGRQSLDFALLLGVAGSVLAFAVVAGSAMLAPGRERYALCLMAPVVLLAARGFTWLADRPGRSGRLALTAGVLVAWCWIAGFAGNFVAFVDRTGGEAHPTFRTAQVEPKAAVAALLCESGQPAYVAVAEVWNEWPLRYLAYTEPQVEIVAWADANDSAALADATSARRAWLVAYAGSAAAAAMRQHFDRAGKPYRELAITDSAGRPVIVVYAPPAGR